MKRLVIVLALAACEGKQKPPPPPEPIVAPPASTPTKPPYEKALLVQFLPLPAKMEMPDNPFTDEKTAAGRTTFFEKCNTCHDVTKNGAGGQVDRVNAPTVFNAPGQFAMGWTGKWQTFEEMIAPHGNVDDKKAKNVAVYVRKLLTPSRWDKFIAGDETALGESEKQGLGAFLETGCVTCHAGKLLGGTQYQKLGVAKPWPTPAGQDKGRFEITKADPDLHAFKVPSLRNVTKTTPWLHDGSLNSLEETVKLMARYQLGKEVEDETAKRIVTFLGALDGEPPVDLAKKP